MHHPAPAVDRETLGRSLHELHGRYRRPLLIVGFAALLVAAVLAVVRTVLFAEDGLTRFAFAYLWGYWYALTICVGALFYVMVQHVVRAGWSVTTRRMAEILAANVWVLIPLSIPILLCPFLGIMYPWSDDDVLRENPLIASKSAYLNPIFFLVRWLIYFGVWTYLGRRLYSLSVKQDETGDPSLTADMAWTSAWGLFATFLTVSFAGVDMLMSLTPTWYSTIFGVYLIAGAAVSIHALLALATVLFRRIGFLRGAVTVEHQHDLGKLMFGFTVFWAYIAFSQYLLIWYADIPEETEWYLVRQQSAWKWLSLALLACQFIIPFFGLLSRHVKRNDSALLFWACWILAAHALDLYFIIYPSLPVGAGWPIPFGFIDVACLVGISGLFFGSALSTAATVPLVPVGDPRLHESLAFHNT